jgi:hypothetical protein
VPSWHVTGWNFISSWFYCLFIVVSTTAMRYVKIQSGWWHKNCTSNHGVMTMRSYCSKASNILKYFWHLLYLKQVRLSGLLPSNNNLITRSLTVSGRDLNPELPECKVMLPLDSYAEVLLLKQCRWIIKEWNKCRFVKLLFLNNTVQFAPSSPYDRYSIYLNCQLFLESCSIWDPSKNLP